MGSYWHGVGGRGEGGVWEEERLENLDFIIYRVDDPGEQAVVEVFTESIAGDGSLGSVEISHNHVVLTRLEVMVTRRAHVRQAALHHLVNIWHEGFDINVKPQRKTVAMQSLPWVENDPLPPPPIMEAEWERRLVRGWLLCIAVYVRWESESRGNVDSREKQLMDGSAVSVEQLFTVNVRYSKALRRWSTEINSSIDTSSSSVPKAKAKAKTKAKTSFQCSALFVSICLSVSECYRIRCWCSSPRCHRYCSPGRRSGCPVSKQRPPLGKCWWSPPTRNLPSPTLSKPQSQSQTKPIDQWLCGSIQRKLCKKIKKTKWPPWCCRSPPYHWAILESDSTGPCVNSDNSPCSSAASTILPQRKIQSHSAFHTIRHPTIIIPLSLTSINLEKSTWIFQVDTIDLNSHVGREW